MNDFLDYYEDLQSGQAAGIPPDELAPEDDNPEIAPGIPYDEVKDPEAIQEARRIQYEMKLNRLREQRLNESKERAERVQQYWGTTKSPSWQGFTQSDFYMPENKDNETNFNAEVKYLMKGGFISADGKIGGRYGDSGGTAYHGQGESTYSKSHQKIKKTPGPYDAELPDEYVAGQYGGIVDQISSEHGGSSIKTTAEEMFLDVYYIVKNIIHRKTDKRHAIIYGDPGVGKTYEVRETCKKHINESPTNATLVYEAGDIGSSITALVPFFYKHSQNKIIILDDNDKMVMNNLPQEIMNTMKALMDPAAGDDKPVTVRSTILDICAKRMGDLDDDEELPAGMRKKEGAIMEVDMDALRENRFIFKVNDEPVVDKMISLRESQELQNKVIPLREKAEARDNIYARSLRHIREASNAEFLDEYDEYENPDDAEEREWKNLGLSKQEIEEKKQGRAMKKAGATESGDKEVGFPRRFMFNSSIIFISNLEMNDINTAVLDRAEAVEVKLTMDQFLDRLGRIYGGLAKIGMDSQVDPGIREWARKCVYTLIGITIELWKSQKPVFGGPIKINRKLTFRMFDEFVSAWERAAMKLCDLELHKDLNSADKKLLDHLSQKLINIVLKQKVIPFLATPVRG